MSQFGLQVCSLLFLLTWFSVSGLQLFNESVGVSDGSCPPWLQPGNSSADEPSCVCPVDNWRDILTCDDVHQQSFLRTGFCITFSNSTLFLAQCPYVYKEINDSNFIALPRNLSDINTYFCESQNRKGYLCDECKEHFGVPLLLNTYRCEDCRKTPHGVLRYLALQFIPLTVFFFVILLSQISITKPPMSTFVLYCQFISLFFRAENPPQLILLEDNGSVWKWFSVVLSFYDVWNLDFGIRFITPFCVSPTITSFQAFSLSYVSAFYPLFLVIFTYMLIDIYGRNFRPLVWLWKPFKKLFVKGNWNPMESIIDVFATFFLLSYSKLLFTSLMSLHSIPVYNITTFPPQTVSVIANVDATLRVFHDGHIVYAVLALLVLVVVVFLPVLLVGNLVSRCCSCGVCSSRHWQVLRTFIEKFNGYYKDGTVEGTRDYRWVSLMPFALRIVILFVSNQTNVPFSCVYFTRGFLFFTLALFTAIFQPYKKQYMTFVDTLLMANLGLLSFMFTALKYLVPFHSKEFSVIYRILILAATVPQIVLSIFVCYKVVVRAKHAIKTRTKHDDEEMNVSTQLLPDRLVNGNDSLEYSNYGSISE